MFITNGLINLLIILLTMSILSLTLIYPIMAVGGIMVVTMFSTIVFKEKMYWFQWVGLLVGCVAVAILSS